MTLESAIPSHLITERTRPVGHPDTYEPPYPGFAARFDPSLTTVVMAYYGVQYRGDTVPDVVAAALAELGEATAVDGGPVHWDRARYVDEAGYTTVVNALYWLDPAEFKVWRASAPEWTSPARFTPEAGFFTEVVTPKVERFETLFSSDRIYGIAVASEQLSDMVVEHAYWGSARDRIPASQTDGLEPHGQVSASSNGRLTTVTPGSNLCLIRSGKDWSETEGDERRMYLGEVYPKWREGMEFLRDDGREIECYANRHMRVLDDQFQDTDEAYAMSWWRSLADLEAWAKSHPTHKAIFGAAMNYLSTMGPAAKLRLYHEITIVDAEQSEFEYLGCHPETGMLRALG
jgi:aldoxime dehydratase